MTLSSTVQDIGAAFVTGSASRALAASIAAPQRRFDLVAPDVVDSGGASSGGGRHQVGVRAIGGRDGQYRVLRSEIADAANALCPRHGTAGGEGIDVHHPQPDTPIAVQRVDGPLNVADLLVAEDARVIRDVIGKAEGRLGVRSGRQQRGSGEQRDEHADQTGKAHEYQM